MQAALKRQQPVAWPGSGLRPDLDLELPVISAAELVVNAVAVVGAMVAAVILLLVALVGLGA